MSRAVKALKAASVALITAGAFGAVTGLFTALKRRRSKVADEPVAEHATRVASSVAISLNTAAIAALVLVPVAIGWALLRRAPLGTDEVP
ncbi:MAG: hypothetical protein IT373_03315, partial [Polyangiaceae bacterium]|nr:hypothetical protein [Polyangiaceae bacterium]